MRSNTKRMLLAVVMLLMSFTLTACDDPGLVDELFEMALEWATQRKLISVDDKGEVSVNYGQVALYEAERRWDWDDW